MSSRKKYSCKHCHTVWNEPYLADLCFKVDMENLENETTGKVLIPIEEYKQRQAPNESAKVVQKSKSQKHKR